MDIKPRNGPVAYIASAFSGDIEGNTEKTKKIGMTKRVRKRIIQRRLRKPLRRLLKPRKRPR